jgi:hypothetical protein
MNSKEVSRALLIIDAIYGAKMQGHNREFTLVIPAWTAALSDVPWTPYGENALNQWIRTEPWPPVPSEIRELAKKAKKKDREQQEYDDLQSRLSLPEGKREGFSVNDPPMRKALEMRRNGEIGWAEVSDTARRLAEQSESNDS